MRLSSSLAAGLGPSSARLAMRTQPALSANTPQGEELLGGTKEKQEARAELPTGQPP